MKKVIYLVTCIIILLVLFSSCSKSFLCQLYDTDQGIVIYSALSYSASSEDEAVEKCKEDYSASYYRCTCWEE